MPTKVTIYPWTYRYIPGSKGTRAGLQHLFFLAGAEYTTNIVLDLTFIFFYYYCCTGTRGNVSKPGWNRMLKEGKMKAAMKVWSDLFCRAQCYFTVLPCATPVALSIGSPLLTAVMQWNFFFFWRFFYIRLERNGSIRNSKELSNESFQMK